LLRGQLLLLPRLAAASRGRPPRCRGPRLPAARQGRASRAARDPTDSDSPRRRLGPARRVHRARYRRRRRQRGQEVGCGVYRGWRAPGPPDPGSAWQGPHPPGPTPPCTMPTRRARPSGGAAAALGDYGPWRQAVRLGCGVAGGRALRAQGCSDSQTNMAQHARGAWPAQEGPAYLFCTCSCHPSIPQSWPHPACQTSWQRRPLPLQQQQLDYAGELLKDDAWRH
jgi:hypothetical protein